MKARFKNARLQRLYVAMLERARNGHLTEEHKGRVWLRTGCSWDQTFWRGYHHAKMGNRPAYSTGTDEHACYAAGKDFRNETSLYVGLPGSSGFPYKDCRARTR